MARTKRKINPLVQEVESPAPARKIYKTAAYVRLSVEDSGKPGADTIEGQKALLTSFIESKSDLEFAALFCDNGRTGTDFDRPQFEKMMEEVRKGRVNCIVVKDLSRFGRNYKETGNYLERIFPFLGVRFIAVNDNFDTLTAERTQDGYIVPLKNLINEVYSKDISKKSASALHVKQQRGEFIGAWAPYGYRKDPDNKHHGKRERDMVGNWHTVKRSKADWIVVDETHEGIISKDDFQKVASRMKEYKEFIPCVSERNPLRKKVICGTCGYAMALSNTKNAKYHCRTSHLETDFDCTSEGILQADIHEMVVTLIRTYAAYAVSLEHLLLLQKERIQAEKKQARRELAVVQSRKNQFEKSLQDLYEKLIDGTIDKETYLSQKASNQAQMQELTEKMERLEKSSQTSTEQGGAFIEKYKEYTELETLTSDIANDVVKRVTVYKDGGIEIELALRDELEKLLTCLETVDAAS